MEKIIIEYFLKYSSWNKTDSDNRRRQGQLYCEHCEIYV